jgi:hypothetical protein
MDIPPPAKATLKLLPYRPSANSSASGGGGSLPPNQEMDLVGMPTTNALNHFINGYAPDTVGRIDSTFVNSPFYWDPSWMNPSSHVYANAFDEGQRTLPSNHLGFSRNPPNQREIQSSPNAYAASVKAPSLHSSTTEHHLGFPPTFLPQFQAHTLEQASSGMSFTRSLTPPFLSASSSDSSNLSQAHLRLWRETNGPKKTQSGGLVLCDGEPEVRQASISTCHTKSWMGPVGAELRNIPTGDAPAKAKAVEAAETGSVRPHGGVIPTERKGTFCVFTFIYDPFFSS